VEAAAAFDCESTLTDRYQTTVPARVREALNLGKHDKLHYTVSPGRVVVTRATKPEQEDPVLGRFLAFVAEDIAAHPERVRVIDKGLYDRIQALVGHIAVNLDEPLAALPR
jgi:antitoxin PrlF